MAASRVAMADGNKVELPPEPTYGADGGRRAIRGQLIRPIIAVDKWVKVPGLVPVIHGGAVSNVAEIQWRWPALVADATGTTVADGTDLGASSIAVQAEINANNESIFVDGDKPDYITFMGLGFRSGPRQVYRLVANGDLWRFTFKNYHGANDYTPEMVFGIRRLDKDELAELRRLFERR